MNGELSGWWTIAQNIGAGATFVLGVVVYCLWARLSGEWDYSRKRDKETLDVLNGINQLISSGEREAETHADKLLAAIQLCQTTIIANLDKITHNRNSSQ